MKTLTSLFSTVANCLWWAGVFLACRVAVWLAAKPAWWTIPLALAAGAAWLAFRALGRKHDAWREEQAPFSVAVPAAVPAVRAPASARARLRRAWQQGRALRAGNRFRPAPPLYLFLNLTPGAAASPLELGDAFGQDALARTDDFTWRRAPDAAWIDCPDALLRNDGGGWGAFADIAGEAEIAGVVVALDAARLAAADHAAAPMLRQRLEALQRGQKRPLPVYLVVDNIDRLYGLRSLVSRVDPGRLADPLGDIRDQARENSPAFFRRVLADSAALLERLGRSAIASAPAALLAREELLRLEEPLVRFCRQVFLKGSSHGGQNAGSGRHLPWIRGLFLAASAPGGGDAVPPVLARLESFADIHRDIRETLPVQPWFLHSALRDAIPADAGAAREAGSPGGRSAYPAYAAGLIAGALALSLLLTWSFLENRTILLSARGRAAPPETAESLESYRELAAATRLRADGLRPPRFGMTEARDLAGVLQRRYTDSYFDLKTIPSIEHVQDAALAAAESGSPAEIGNALLLLAVAREGIARNLDASGGEPTEQTRFLHALVASLRLAAPADMRQLETYFAWAGKQDWMPETRDALEAFERYLVDNAAGGDVASWLSEWVGGLPGLRAVDASRVWEAPLADNSASIIAPEWTREGYAIARGLLDAVSCGSGNQDAWREKREAALERYRTRALERWRGAAAALWSKFRRRIPDGEVQAMLRAAVRGDDPASRFLSLLRHHLMYMFDAAGPGDNPDAIWLFLHDALAGADAADEANGGLASRIAHAVRGLGDDDNLDRWSRQLGLAAGGDDLPAREAWSRWRGAVRRYGMAAEAPADNFTAVREHFRAGETGSSGAPATDPLLEAGREAEFLHRHLREKAGSAAWDSLSPLAMHDYLRYLATRAAALHLDALWREEVYNPAHLAAGDDADRLDKLAAAGGALEKFLAGPARGFWHWDGTGLANARWRRLPFMFDDVFLDFCRTAMREERPRPPEALELPLTVRAVDVDREAKERPVTVEFALRSGREKQSVFFSNYRISEPLIWRPGRETSAEIRVYFPSVEAVAEFRGKVGLGNFVSALSAGELHLDAGLFPEAEPALRRMGVNRIVVKASVENGGQVLEYLNEKPFTLPRSVITPGPAGAGDAVLGVANGPY